MQMPFDLLTAILIGAVNLANEGAMNSPTQVDLFDYQTDPTGKVKIAGSQPDTVTELLNRISEQ